MHDVLCLPRANKPPPSPLPLLAPHPKECLRSKAAECRVHHVDVALHQTAPVLQPRSATHQLCDIAVRVCFFRASVFLSIKWES